MSLLDKFKKTKKPDTIESSIDNDFVDNKVVLTAEQKKKADPKYRILEIYEEEKKKQKNSKESMLKQKRKRTGYKDCLII